MELQVPPSLWRTAQPDHDEWVASAVGLLDLLARSLELDDLSGSSVLDVGCGTKFTKVILEQDIPIGRYVGIDTSADVIRFLDEHVDDPRFEFHHLDAHNDLYNPDGTPLADFASLPVDGERFDVLCLFSVFTHLAPDDYRAMLELLRGAVSPTGGLVYSLFVQGDALARENAVEREAALAREMERRLAAGDDAIVEAIGRQLSQPVTADGEIPDFVDRIPEHPLMEAVYSERHARELIAGTGWDVVALHQPQRPIIQHYFVCRPGEA